MKLLVVDHPLAKTRLTTLRNVNSTNATFRAALRDLTLMLMYEATRDLPYTQFPVHTPLVETEGYGLAGAPLLVPVLRAGLGMVDQAHSLIPEAQVGFVGIARDETTAQPVPYFASLPEDLSSRPVLVLDPMLATGGSMVHTLSLLRSRGADNLTVVCVVCAPQGLAALEALQLPLHVVTASVDEGLNSSNYIIPGLGDAGDRQFGAR